VAVAVVATDLVAVDNQVLAVFAPIHYISVAMGLVAVAEADSVAFEVAFAASDPAYTLVAEDLDLVQTVASVVAVVVDIPAEQVFAVAVGKTAAVAPPVAVPAADTLVAVDSPVVEALAAPANFVVEPVEDSSLAPCFLNHRRTLDSFSLPPLSC
jgi:hypothetical protein